ncbi:MAG: acyltransferase [Gammaproteobacteria bacterium]
MNGAPGKTRGVEDELTTTLGSADRVISGRPHLAVLDGWRGLSILFVLASHLLPLGPKAWQLNEMTGPMGMALFFTLSGFLITRILLADADIPKFLVRRGLRIVPLAWLAMAIAFPLSLSPASVYLPNFLFYANLPPQHLAEVASHLWSLCVEMQFYLAIALVVRVGGTRGLYLMPLCCVAVTANRVLDGAYVDIVTWRRVDEILAGATLALVYSRQLGTRLPAAVPKANAYLFLALFALSCHPLGGFMNYLRPYFAAVLVGTTLFRPTRLASAVLKSRPLRYIAAVSFALYVIHGLLVDTWLGSGDKLVKYLKRPLFLGVTFALAHVSTFYYERHWIDWGKRLTSPRRTG